MNLGYRRTFMATFVVSAASVASLTGVCSQAHALPQIPGAPTLPDPGDLANHQPGNSPFKNNDGAQGLINDVLKTINNRNTDQQGQHSNLDTNSGNLMNRLQCVPKIVNTGAKDAVLGGALGALTGGAEGGLSGFGNSLMQSLNKNSAC